MSCKKYFFFPILILHLFTTNIHARPFSEIKASGKLVIVTTEDEINIVKDKSGSIMGGFNFELAKAFAASLNLTIETRIINDFGMYFSIDKAGADIRKDSEYIPYIFTSETADIAVDLITRTNWRERLFSMVPIIKNKQILFTRTSNPKKINNFSDLAGARFILLKDSTYLATFENLIRPKVKSISFELESALDLNCVEAVMDGRFEYSIIDSITFIQYKRRYPNLKKVVPVSDEEDLCWAIRADNPELVKALKNFLDEFKRTDEFHKIFRRYFLIPYFSYRILLEK